MVKQVVATEEQVCQCVYWAATCTDEANLPVKPTATAAVAQTTPHMINLITEPTPFVDKFLGDGSSGCCHRHSMENRSCSLLFDSKHEDGAMSVRAMQEEIIVKKRLVYLILISEGDHALVVVNVPQEFFASLVLLLRTHRR